MGFPSGHATAASAFFGALFYLAATLSPLPRALVRIGAVVTIVLVAIARIVLRAHWTDDSRRHRTRPHARVDCRHAGRAPR
jgi:membrane-associated phospholipid phosphatase